MNDAPDWFAPRRYGIGSSLPISWQGWLVLFAYIAIVCAAPWLFAPRIYLGLSIIIAYKATGVIRMMQVDVPHAGRP